jgi:hypothetical protein
MLANFLNSASASLAVGVDKVMTKHHDAAYFPGPIPAGLGFFPPSIILFLLASSQFFCPVSFQPVAYISFN